MGLTREHTFRFCAHGALSALLVLVLPVLAFAAPLELYFEDGFDSNAGKRFFFEGTLDQRLFSYEGGEYQIDTRRSEAYGQSILLEDLATYSVEVTGRIVETSDSDGGGFGLSFNYQERESTSDFLLFLAYDRGAFTVLRYSAGRTAVLFSPTKTKAFKPGEAVTLRVDSAKGGLRFFINGIEVAKLSETSLVSGGMGVFATGRSLARFDNFRVFSEKAVEQGFSDDFAKSRRLYEGNWEDISYGYSSGQYLIDTTKTTKIGLSPFPEKALSFEFSADAVHLGGDALGTYGLFFRDYANQFGSFNQLRFLLGGGWFAVEQSIEDRPLALTEWKESSAIKVGQTNRLKVEALGESIVFYINGQEVHRLRDSAPHEGSYGFFASAGVKVAFDNAELKKQR